MPAWLRTFLEVLVAQVAVWLLAGLAALATGLLAAVLAGPDAMNLGPALGMLLGGVLGFLVAFVALWLLVWWRWFRRRVPVGHFLLAWIASLVLVWSVAPLAGGGGPRVERVEGPPLVLRRVAPDAPAFALAPRGEPRLVRDGAEVAAFAERRCETLADGEACFLLVRGELPADVRLRLRMVRTEPAPFPLGLFGWLRDVEEGVEERPLVVREAPPPRIAALAWKVAEGRLVVRVESEAPLVVDALCFRFDGELGVRTGAGGDALRPGVYRRLADREMLCVDPKLGYAGPLPALVAGERDFPLPALPAFDDPETHRGIAREIRTRGLAGGRDSVSAEVRLLGRFPDGTPVEAEAAFDLRPELS